MNTDNLHFLMDESDAPFNMDDMPYDRSADDDRILIEMTEKYGLELSPDSELAALRDSLG